MQPELARTTQEIGPIVTAQKKSRGPQTADIYGRPLEKCTVFKARKRKVDVFGHADHLDTYRKDERAFIPSVFDEHRLVENAFYHDTMGGIVGPFTTREWARESLKSYKIEMEQRALTRENLGI